VAGGHPLIHPTNGNPAIDMEPSFTPIEEIGEFGLIDRIEAVLGEPADDRLIAAIGDDAAVYSIGDDRVHVLTSDGLIEGVHFDLSFIPMEHLGAKSLTVNISDVVAMNAEPKYATVVLGIPGHVSVEMVEDFYRGAKKVCDAYGVAIVGGDVTGARQFTVSVTLIGEAMVADVVYRRGAKPGDLLCVTGDLGSAYAGLRVLLRQRAELEERGADFRPDIESYRFVINRNLTPVARLGFIRLLAAAGVKPNAMIDISDGLASEVNHLCRRSGCGAVVRLGTLPIHEQTVMVARETGEEPSHFALNGGEDYELLFALAPEDADKVEPTLMSVIGEFVEGSDVTLVHDDGREEPLRATSWDHFRGEEG
jgi:thiamine-monophosphate kinase